MPSARAVHATFRCVDKVVAVIREKGDARVESDVWMRTCFELLARMLRLMKDF